MLPHLSLYLYFDCVLGPALDLAMTLSSICCLTGSRASRYTFPAHSATALSSPRGDLVVFPLQNLISGLGAPPEIADAGLSLRSWPFTMLGSSSTTPHSEVFQGKGSSPTAGLLFYALRKLLLPPMICSHWISEVRISELIFVRLFVIREHGARFRRHNNIRDGATAQVLPGLPFLDTKRPLPLFEELTFRPISCFR